MGEMRVSGACTVQVLLFASLRDRAGWSSRPFTLSSQTGCTARDIWQLLDLGAWPNGVRVAVNQSFVSEHHPLAEGDELAFLPPFTGG
ncbi:MoaD/ThiS family protein [Synechococcus sp. W2B2]|jgi:molybdopterin synthase sulfur carrier subunit|uniref:MoaD/ThiS family protein n=1 Tax=unclassified Synechococcus TaxID=2626047 RepID=UPI00006B9FF9|nr:MoaD/ThiS family protein [Synechococcus sp. WH 7805]EAR17790.1 molydbenum cofactor biosynthesis protein D (molybdopterin converting factor small subunit) [Synechococcus sp. WH 7805]